MHIKTQRHNASINVNNFSCTKATDEGLNRSLA